MCDTQGLGDMSVALRGLSLSESGFFEAIIDYQEFAVNCEAFIEALIYFHTL